MSQIKVLHVDDDKDVRESLRCSLKAEREWELEDQGFAGVKETLARFRPDLVVLDLVEGTEMEGTASGNRIFGNIWDNWFCPIVVYSAFIGKQEFEHSFVATVKKGSGSLNTVRDRLDSFILQAEMIRSVHLDFDARIREALRDSVYAVRGQIGNTRKDESVPRAVRRLVAARVDVGASREAKLHAWERFVVPPLGDQFLTADLLKEKDADWREAKAFRLVLSPSCDLVHDGSQNSKVDRILVARCEEMKRLGKIEPCLSG